MPEDITIQKHISIRSRQEKGYRESTGRRSTEEMTRRHMGSGQRVPSGIKAGLKTR